MEKSNDKLFIDSNFFIALYNPLDTLNEKAKETSKQIQKDNPQTIISNFVFLEAVTVISQRAGRVVAIAAGKKLIEAHSFIFINETQQRRSWEIFQQIQRKNVSFVDSSILAIMEQEEIRYLLTFYREDFLPLQKLYKFKLYNP